MKPDTVTARHTGKNGKSSKRCGLQTIEKTKLESRKEEQDLLLDVE